MKYLLSPFYPIANNLGTSHRAGWARYWAHALGDTEVVTTATQDGVLEGLGKKDTVYLYHGMEFKGALNLQSGLTDTIVARVDQILRAKARGTKFISLDINCPMYGSLMELRGLDDEVASKLDRICRAMAVDPVPRINPFELIVGDSHSLSMYDRSRVVYRRDGQTLYGAMGGRSGLRDYVGSFVREHSIYSDRLCLYFGNIDIRHHLMRQVEPEKAVIELANDYVAQASGLRDTYKHVSIVEPLFIENESRKIPTSGFYKGTGFFGSWEDRDKLRYLFAEVLVKAVQKKSSKIDLVTHPKRWMNPRGELSFDVMETPRSVHIRPDEYRLILNGGKW